MNPLEGSKLFRLGPGDSILPFDCDDNDLNDFIANDAHKYLSELIATTYLIQNDIEIIAFFSLANDRIDVRDTTKSSFRKIKKKFDHQQHRSNYPAVKLARLAVSKKYQRKGIGQYIIDYITMLFLKESYAGCRFVTVDAYSKSIRFYQRYGFKELSGVDKQESTRIMYLDLLPIAKSFPSDLSAVKEDTIVTVEGVNNPN